MIKPSKCNGYLRVIFCLTSERLLHNVRQQSNTDVVQISSENQTVIDFEQLKIIFFTTVKNCVFVIGTGNGCPQYD